MTVTNGIFQRQFLPNKTKGEGALYRPREKRKTKHAGAQDRVTDATARVVATINLLEINGEETEAAEVAAAPKTSRKN